MRGGASSVGLVSSGDAQGAVARDVAVAISTLDREDVLARCLDSLGAGSVRPAEIVVVDQARGEGAEHLVAERRLEGMPIRYLRQRDRRGLGASQNLAVGSATTPIVAVIDDDCVADAGWLEALVRPLRDGTADATAGRVLPLAPVGDRVHPVSSRTATEPRTFVGKDVPWLVGSGNNFAVRREAFLAIGGCDERLGPGSPARGGVDMDLFYRLLRAGARIRYVPEALVLHERQTLAERMARRPMYGRGMGAAIALWMRQRDPYAVATLARWVALRGRLLLAAARRGNALGVREELVMLGSTVRGLAHGLTVGGDDRRG